MEIHRIPMVMENLEKSWNFKMPFFRPGKAMEFFKITESFGKVMKFDCAPYELAECVCCSA